MAKPKIFLDFKSPFAADLKIHSFHGEERLSAPFHFTVELRSKKPSLDFKKIIGKGVTITIGIEAQHRYIHGLATRFIQGGTTPDETVYYLEMRPWFWMLSLTRDSRIFQNKSVPEIIQAVFKDYGFHKMKKSLKGSYAKRDYTVQHQESDFDFVCRLMEDEGIFYFFDHTASDHTMVLADDTSAHKPCPGLKETKFASSQAAFANDVISDCTLEEQVTTNAYAMADYNFEVPKTSLMSKVKGASPTLAIYEYPGGFMKKDAGDSRSKKRIESHEEPAKSLRGQGRVRGFIAGFKFKMVGHKRADVNGEYVLRWVSHSATLDNYSNTFDALPAKTPFRPPVTTRKPLISGSETALVVGKSGEEIWTDKYGRVKVHFPWDRHGKKDDKSSCWVRVSQTWAGKQWGTWFLPRMGQEVIVTFIDGDPDRPLVTGAVYNAEQTVPYALPGQQTKSTIKTNSSKGGGGFNELRFEDKKGKEEIFIQAQKDMNIKVKHDRKTDILHDDTLTVTHDRSATIKQGHDTIVVKMGNRSVEVKVGSDTLKVTGIRTVKIIGNETHDNKGNFTHTVTGDYTLKVKGDFTMEVTGKVSIKASDDYTLVGEKNIKTKSGMAYANESGTEFTNKAGTKYAIKGGTDVDIEAGVGFSSKAGVGYKAAGTQVEVKASAMGTLDGGGMLTVKGGLVKIN
jgi:type VI secretion system secreted protein VgrG